MGLTVKEYCLFIPTGFDLHFAAVFTRCLSCCQASLHLCLHLNRAQCTRHAPCTKHTFVVLAAAQVLKVQETAVEQQLSAFMLYSSINRWVSRCVVLCHAVLYCPMLSARAILAACSSYLQAAEYRGREPFNSEYMPCKSWRLYAATKCCCSPSRSASFWWHCGTARPPDQPQAQAHCICFGCVCA